MGIDDRGCNALRLGREDRGSMRPGEGEIVDAEFIRSNDADVCGNCEVGKQENDCGAMNEALEAILLSYGERRSIPSPRTTLLAATRTNSLFRSAMHVLFFHLVVWWLWP